VSTHDNPELLGAGAGGGALAAPIAGDASDLLGAAQVKARGYWELVWLRFRRDKFAIVGGSFIVLLVLAAFVGAPVARHFLGHGPSQPFFGTADKPLGPFSHVIAPDGHKQLLILGGDDATLQRDVFLRLLYGAQVSLEVGIGAMLFSMITGVVLGSIAGFFRGPVDTLISRLIEVTMAFPAILFAIALASTVGPRFDNITFGVFSKGVITLVFVIGLFSWYYPARIVRAQVLSLREKEFVEAARMTGASDWRIIRSHILPHLVGPVIVYSTLIVATNILFEAGLSFLNVGIKQPDPSWGNLLSNAPQYYTVQPLLMIWPGVAVLLTTLAFNLLGDGLRDAFDPRAAR
jgi:ABC-type dipeptide/oligopeptide/nickel transport system permease subunit